ncbi:MAG TPA: MFS transporter [Micromonosporaceae bacterium]
MVSGAAGLGAAAGPLVGGVITTSTSWRASFVVQVLVVVWIIYLARGITEAPGPTAGPHFDLVGAALSAIGLALVVLGILTTGSYGWTSARKDLKIGSTVVIPEGGIAPVWPLLVLGGLVLLWFFRHLQSTERSGGEPLLHLRLFRNRTANLGLGTQHIQWLTMQGSFFVISVFLQEVRGYNAIQTGLALTPATVGILLASGGAERFARRRTQRWLILTGFVATVAGIGLLLALVRDDTSVLRLVPGLFMVGAGVGVMLTSSVNVVQSSFPGADQGDISGLSRSVSNLGSSLGTALAGSVLVAAYLIPREPTRAAAPAS